MEGLFFRPLLELTSKALESLVSARLLCFAFQAHPQGWKDLIWQVKERLVFPRPWQPLTVALSTVTEAAKPPRFDQLLAAVGPSWILPSGSHSLADPRPLLPCPEPRDNTTQRLFNMATPTNNRCCRCWCRCGRAECRSTSRCLTSCRRA